MSTATTHIDNKPSLRGTKQSYPLVPALRFKEFCREWNEILLDDFAQRGSGHTPSKSFPEYYNGDINWISLTDSKRLDNGFIEETNSKITQKGIDNSSAVLHPAGTVLLSRDAGVGKSAVMKHSMAVSQHFIVWRTQDDKSSNWFLYNWLQIMKPHFERMAVGNTIKTIGLPYFKKLKIVTPQYTEQQKIASFLSSVDEKIQQLTKKKELLEQYKKGVMQQLFSGQLRFKDENGKDYPDWEEKRLGEIGEFKTSSVDKKIVEGETLVKLVNYMNVYRHEEILPDNIDNLMVVSAKTNQLETSDLKKGDVLFTPSSETPDDIGHSVVIFKDLPNTLYSYHLMRFRPSIKLDLMYSHFFCNTADVLRQISRFATGSTRFTISVGNFSAIKLSIPCFEEQQKIATYLSGIDTKIAAVTHQITQTQTFKKGLLQQLFV
jgi:type I restriction enzyme S subunit